MKFVAETVTRGMPRVGKLTNFARIPDVNFETPLVLVYTKKGAVPHLTKDVFKKITSSPQLLSVNLSTSVTMKDAIKAVGVSFADFVCMKEYINFLCIQDPACVTDISIQSQRSVSVWSRHGRHAITANEYMDIVESYKPDIYLALCCGSVDINSSNKYLLKSMERGKALLEQCLKRHSMSENLKDTPVLGAIEGGYNMEHRESSINFLKDKPLAGYVIDGLHINGPDVKNIPIEQIKEIVKYTIESLPADRLRVSMGCWNPVTVLGLIELGVDVFDTSYPYTCTENGQALTFMCNHQTCNNVLGAMIVAEKRYKDDFAPICSDCTCLTCKNHTRAYLHHLYHTKEMLGIVLLMIHNTHYYLDFFNTIRESIKGGTFQELQKKVCSKYLQITPSNEM